MAPVTIYTTRICPYCIRVKRLFDSLGVAYEEIGLDGQYELRARLSEENGGWRTVPMVFIGDRFVGGFDDVNELRRSGELQTILGL